MTAEDDIRSLESLSDDSRSAGSLVDFIVDDEEVSIDFDETAASSQPEVRGSTIGMTRFLTAISNIEQRVVRAHNKKLQAGGGAKKKAPSKAAPKAKEPSKAAPKATKAGVQKASSGVQKASGAQKASSGAQKPSSGAQKA